MQIMVQILNNAKVQICLRINGKFNVVQKEVKTPIVRKMERLSAQGQKEMTLQIIFQCVQTIIKKVVDIQKTIKTLIYLQIIIKQHLSLKILGGKQMNIKLQLIRHVLTK